MSSETHRASSDGTAIHGDHEAAVMDYDYLSSSNATLKTNYPSSSYATLTTNNGVTTGYQLRNNNWSKESVYYGSLCVAFYAGLIAFILIEPAYVPPLTFKVVSLQVAPMTISNNLSSADVILTLSLTNKDQQQLLIEPLVVSIMYHDQFLSSKKIDPLVLSSQNNKSIQLDMGITAPHLNAVTVDSTATDLAINHSLELKILIQGRYSILKSGDIRDDIYGVAITCDGVKVNFSSVESNLSAGISGPYECKHILA